VAEEVVQGTLLRSLLCYLCVKMPLWGMLVSSTYGIVALTFERFLAVVYPIWHKTKFNRSKARDLCSSTMSSLSTYSCPQSSRFHQPFTM